MRTIFVSRSSSLFTSYRGLGFSWVLICLLILTVCPQVSQAASAPGKKNKKEVPRDPLASKIGSTRVLSSSIQEALKRSGQPGVIRAEKPIAGLIYEIRIEGAHKIEADAVFLDIESQLGEPVDADVVANDIRHVFDLGLFSYIDVDQSEGPDGSVVLTYRLKEKPTIHEVKIEGNDAISEDDIKEAIELKQYQIADMTRIRDTADKIRQLYTDKGYFLAEVSYRLVPAKDDGPQEDDTLRNAGIVPERKFSPQVPKGVELVDVVFTIVEQPKIKIESISFLGNTTLSNDKIKAAMRSKENHPLGALTQWGTYSEEAFDIDLLLIEQLYQENGFLNVQVNKPRVTISPDKTRLSIHIPITEGKQYKLGKVSVSGDLVESNEETFMQKREENPDEPLFLEKRLTDRITLQEGETFNRTQMARDVLTMNELYKDEGFAYVNVTPVPTIDEDERIVHIKVTVDKGPRVNIERIDIKGNNKTADEVIRRELRLFEGDRYSSSLLRLSEQRINQTGFFESVKISEKQGSTPDQMILEVEVVEKSNGQINAGIGYGMGGEGIIGKAQVSQNNLFGRGQFLALQIEWSRFRRIFDGRFIDPYIGYIADAPLMLSFAAYNTKRYMNNFNRDSTGGDLTFGYPIGQPFAYASQRLLKDASPAALPYIPDLENLQVTLGYVLERVFVTEDGLNENLWGLHVNEPRYTTSLKGSILFDQRNNRMAASAGYYFQATGEFASPYFGSGALQLAENAILAKERMNTGLDAGLTFMRQDARANLFSRYTINAKVYYNFDRWFPLKNWVLKLNVDLGILSTFNQQLIFENYAMGGITTLRGYYYRSVGPVVNAARLRNPTAPLNSFIIGGNKQFLTNLELEFPIVKQIGLSFVLFYDMGNVFGPDENFFYIGTQSKHLPYEPIWDPVRDLPFSLYAAAGFGVRWNSPFGLVRFEWGFPIFRRPVGTPGIPAGDEVVNFEFNVGSSF